MRVEERETRDWMDELPVNLKISCQRAQIAGLDFLKRTFDGDHPKTNEEIFWAAAIHFHRHRSEAFCEKINHLLYFHEEVVLNGSNKRDMLEIRLSMIDLENRLVVGINQNGGTV